MASKTRITAKDLGINIASGSEKQLFHWFICVILFSKPVQQEIAGAAFRDLKKEQVDTPERICAAGWQRIVDILDTAHYVRYDESTATRLLDASKKVVDEWDGKMLAMVRSCEKPTMLRKKIQEFNGIGPQGADIFLREVAPVFYR